MDESLFLIRPFTDLDFEPYAEIHRAVRPDVPISTETLRHYSESFESGLVHDRFVAELRRNGQVVAVAGLGEDPFQAHVGKYWTTLFVRPEFQGRGIGSRLYDILLEIARRENGVCLRASVRTQETAGLTFSAHRGFVERRRLWHSVLDVGTADTTPLSGLMAKLRAAGIEFTTFMEEGVNDSRVIQRLFDLEEATADDVPRMDPYVPWSIDQFRKSDLSGPKLIPDAWFIAKAGGEYVALSYAEREPAHPDVLLQEYTCTRRDYRRRHLALTLKLRMIDYAVRRHFRTIRTTNDSLNEPMWKLNEMLGFRKAAITIQLERALHSPSGPPS